MPAAAVTCTVSVTPVTVVYDPTSAVQNETTGSYTISCARAAGDPNTFAWQLGVDDGLQPGAGTNRVQLTPGQRYFYDTYRTLGNLWSDTAPTRFTGTLSFGASFLIVMPASQTAQPAGTYTDTVTATLRDGAGTAINTTTFGVTVLTRRPTTSTARWPPARVARARPVYAPEARRGP